MSIDRVEARARLNLRRDPYWHRLSQGRYVGFRRISLSTPGTWLARLYDPEKPGYRYHQLGDFAQLSDKHRFDAAKLASEEWFRHLDHGGSTARVSIKAACMAYVAKLRLEKSEAAAHDAEGRFRRLVDGDPIGRIELAKLSPRHLAEWKKRAIEKGGSRGYFNRNATSLKAALNLAYRRREVSSDHAWREELRPLPVAPGRRALYLTKAQRLRLIEKASAESRPFFRALALLPLRPGELAILRVEHLKVQQRALEIPTGKTGARIIPLADEALAHFQACAKGKLPTAWLVARADGSQWKKEAWRDEIKPAARKARLPLATVAYTLRHSVITDLVTGGLDLFTVAKLSGTSVLMIEKHYGHLQREHARSALEKLSMR